MKHIKYLGKMKYERFRWGNGLFGTVNGYIQM